MAASNPESMVKQARERQSGELDPLNTQNRDVIKQGGSCYINLTSYARDTLSLDPKDGVQIHTYRDALIIIPSDAE